MAAHRYWRIKAHHTGVANPTNNALSLAEIAIKDTGGTDRTSAASVSVDSSTSGSAADLVDGNAATRWIATDAEHTIKFDFGVGNSHDIDTFILTPPAVWDQNKAPVMMEFQYSDDDSAWSTSFYGCVTYQHWLNSDFTIRVLTFKKPPALVEARYWALWIAAVQLATSYPNIAALELRESIGGPNVANYYSAAGLTYAGSQSPYIGSYGAGNAFDGSNSSVWSSGHADRNWIGFDFGSGNNKRIVEIAVRSVDDATFYQYAPTTCAMLLSADGLAYALAWDVNFSATWTQAQTRTSSNGSPPSPLSPGRRKLFTPS